MIVLGSSLKEPWLTTELDGRDDPSSGRLVLTVDRSLLQPSIFMHEIELPYLGMNSKKHNYLASHSTESCGRKIPLILDSNWGVSG